MKTLCVIETPADLQALGRKKSEVPPDTEYFCSSPEVFALLSQEGIEYTPLTDELLSSEWEEINAWAKRASLRWFEDQAIAGPLTVDGLNLGDILNRPISHTLIYRLKNRLLADYLLERNDFDRIVIFEQSVKKGPKKLRDHGTINEMLDRRVTGSGKIVIRIRSCTPVRTDSLVKHIARRLIGQFYSIVRPRKGSWNYVGMGTLKHLLPLLSRLQDGDSAVFVDEAFQLENYKKCRKNKISYLPADSLISWKEKPRLGWKLFQLKRQIKKLREAISRSSWFAYKGSRVESMGEAVTEILIKQGPARMRQQWVCGLIFKQWKSKAVILHEDVDAFRAAALTARQCGVPVVVLSHGIPPTSDDWSDTAAGIGVADTIVNSEFEKDKYVKTGYESELIHVVGLPRYDLIWKQAFTQREKETKEKIVLYCPHMLTRITKRKKGYLGIHTPGAVTRQNSMEVMQACGRAGCWLLIKPHANSQDLDLWKALVEQHGGPHTELISPRADIFDLIARSDLVIATFSTVVIEAMLFGKNVITINFTGRPDIHPYAERGIALGVYDPRDLDDAVRKCLYDPATQELLRKNREREMEYFGGRFDGKNTERAARFVQLLGEGVSSEKAESMVEDRIAV